jgi:hypothetical protein
LCGIYNADVLIEGKGLQDKREGGRVGEKGDEDEPRGSQSERGGAEQTECGAATVKLATGQTR